MLQSFWDSGTVETAQPEYQTQEYPVQGHLAQEQSVPEQTVQESPAVQQSGTESGAVALSGDDFSALEERILRAVELVKRERQARTEAEERASAAEAQLRNLVPQSEDLQKEVGALRGERDHVRQRVERLLAQLDALEL